MRIAWSVSLCAALLCPLLAAAKNYKGAEYRTKAAYTHGRFEVRMKAAQREGMLASFFTYHDGGGEWNEIDIEILGRYSNDVQFNTITPGQNNHLRHQPTPFNPHLDFHTYAFEWTPEYVAWFIDGVEMYRQTGEHVLMLTNPQKIMMNVWNPAYTNWVGRWSDDALPAFAYYDWVSYASYTPGSGNTGTNNNFTHQWKDDFDSWDQARWDKATHTFGGNNADFVPENVVFRDGLMILCLTMPDNLGYNDRNPPVVKWARLSGKNVTVMFSEEVDQATAETTSNYLIPGVTVARATLLPDQKSVLLETTGLDPTATHTLAVLNARDRAAPPNHSGPRAVSVINEAPVTLPLQINVGGAPQDDFSADQPWSEQVEYGYLDGTAKQWPGDLAIANTEADAIYQSERAGLVSYKVRVPDGNYRVTLMMAENNFTAAGMRVFDVFIEGRLVTGSLDLFQEVGAHAAYTKILDSVAVTDGILDLHFAAVKKDPLLNGLIIETLAATGVNEQEAGAKIYLAQSFPNPFNGGTTIRYHLAAVKRLRFQVFDLRGHLVYEKDLGVQPAGTRDFTWEAVDHAGRPLSSGVYFYTIHGGEKLAAGKLMLLQ
ncbi:MAG: family 16 glycosylhydrolase [candidate division KSB1 bacterium]|nr:family 16 glycosylhydrolase [candidate division KSB1 bacterium]MDZ7276261.1 family 16 glycosylhydrolase [candidate division KSB1 bacterium]MDZ7287933.1 family 16 glycosylhydrolase [candidate division KSB1 bacterium]MDZ7300054.1 family 16 glycosylhydrolase [candidate division KSB1 bacterium]MDZ7307296.1 family 16 glycosylhydrolase [candidate division KSB1 bacterium]